MKPGEWLSNLAWGLVFTPMVMLFPLTWGALNDPSLILEGWDLYLLFYGIPWALALAIWLYIRRTKRRA
jgi:ABC-type sugar transport system permease subunit